VSQRSRLPHRISAISASFRGIHATSFKAAQVPTRSGSGRPGLVTSLARTHLRSPRPQRPTFPLRHRSRTACPRMDLGSLSFISGGEGEHDLTTSTTRTGVLHYMTPSSTAVVQLGPSWADNLAAA